MYFSLRVHPGLVPPFDPHLVAALAKKFARTTLCPSFHFFLHLLVVDFGSDGNSLGMRPSPDRDWVGAAAMTREFPWVEYCASE